MSSPTVIDIPHRLGREEARRRIRARIGELAQHIPGGVAEVESAWPSEDRMTVAVKALGQHVSASVDVGEEALRVSLMLPPLLRMVSGTITEAVARKGAKLLIG